MHTLLDVGGCLQTVRYRSVRRRPGVGRLFGAAGEARLARFERVESRKANRIRPPPTRAPNDLVDANNEVHFERLNYLGEAGNAHHLCRRLWYGLSAAALESERERERETPGRILANHKPEEGA